MYVIYGIMCTRFSFWGYELSPEHMVAHPLHFSLFRRCEKASHYQLAVMICPYLSNPMKFQHVASVEVLKY